MLFISTTPYLGVVFFISLSCIARTGIRTKKIQRKNKFYTNEHSNPLQAMSYLCLDN
nr:MAG TPA: hypothetical protein [Caudoviricetes sp.]